MDGTASRLLYWLPTKPMTLLWPGLCLFYRKNGKGDALEERSRFISLEPTLGRDLHANLGKIGRITNRNKQDLQISLLLINENVLLRSKTMVTRLPPPNPLMVLTMSEIVKIARIRKWRNKL